MAPGKTGHHPEADMAMGMTEARPVAATATMTGRPGGTMEEATGRTEEAAPGNTTLSFQRT